MKFTLGISLLSLALLLSACSTHKIDVQQGNVITQELVAQLHEGMEKKQVQRLLGTPMIEDPFHKERWDYVYRFVVGSSGEIQSGHLSLLFEEDKLSAFTVHQAPPKESEIKTPTLTR